jgi:putative FmdB family regulatory protein
MPRYDFRCTSCGRRFELSRALTEASEPAACPNDGAPATRIFSTLGAYVRGSGIPERGHGPTFAQDFYDHPPHDEPAVHPPADEAGHTH